MVESEKEAAHGTVTLPSASHKSDAKLVVRPGRLGSKRYTIQYSLEDGGPGHWAVLTISFKTANGGSGQRVVRNTGTGIDKGTIRITTTSKVTQMRARVERVDSHVSQSRSDVEVLS